ncbi:acyl-CoA dehydratase activase [Olsenella sp. kh2p3]|jgi:predicted CoA-substrate-specific enzyme activase|uniref:acyl-CoA dehydratase activase n=1 Tax=Olsenella sp. kh2p3 TaxID=1797112 RepID=UPI00091FDEAA|nr:acyl-CoA dehydratase activase [Olsenella sp. kh2p3]SFX05382.1 CoA-substrate-specific enzyme activase, putative [Olsenella sp. kh2p3]
MPAEQQKHNELFYACKYTPIELLAGFGATPRIAEADVASFAYADALAHPNLCGYGKGLIERMMAADVHEAVLVTCCDVVRRVYDVLQASGRMDFLYLLDLPHRRGPAEIALFRRRLRALADAYAAYSGAQFDVGAACAACGTGVACADDRVTLMGAHASSSLVAEVEKGVGMPVENATCTSRHLKVSPPPQLARMATGPACGVCCDGGATPAADPLDAFLDWYAPALLGQIPCMRMDDIAERSELVGERGQQGVVYHTMKFCDYYGFEYGALAEKDEIPMVKIETDGTSQSEGQLRTRLEAFGETLRARGGAAHQVQPAPTASGDAPAAPKAAAYVMGVDSGSTSTDVVIMDADKHIVATAIVPTGARAADAAARAMDEALSQAGLAAGDIALRVSTGYGRDNIEGMDSSVTEITCHARGAHYLAPDARSVIDIGGQDSKVIHLNANGSVAGFVMNDKCAAGTGRFMEAMARVLEMDLDEFCRRGLEWRHEVRITSMCTVFAESEVVSLVAANTPTPDVIHGLDVSVARKTATLASRVGAEPPYLMTGGVAQNEGVVRALSEVLKAPVATHEDSQLCGAIGAALIGLQSLG